MGNEAAKAKAGAGSADAAALTEKDLSDMHLDAIPRELLRCVRLQVLSLSRNRIASAACLCDLRALRRLDLSANALTAIEDELCMLRALEVLDVSKNAIGELNPLLSNLRALRELNVSNNRLAAVTPAICRCESLTSLNLSFNQIVVLPQELFVLSTLTKLLVNNNMIETLPDGIGQLGQLTLLNLGENELVELPGAIGRLKSLAKLYLDNNDLQEIPPEIAHLSSLKELNLRSNRLVDLPSAIGSMPALRMCDLNDNPWSSPSYQSDDMNALLDFLRGKQDKKHRRIVTATKSERRMLAAAAIAKKPVTPPPPADDFVFVKQTKRLLRVKGSSKDKVFVQSVDVTYKSLSEGDSFILDAIHQLYVWLGAGSNAFERAKAQHLAGLLNKEALIPAAPRIIDRARKHVEDEQFWLDLGDKGPVQTTGSDPKEDDKAYGTFLDGLKLFAITEIEGTDRVQVTPIFGCRLEKSMLSSNASYVLDNGTDVFVWCGTYSSGNERSWAWLKAEDLVSKGRRPSFAQIYMVLDDGESVIFIEHFAGWRDDSWAYDEREKERLRKEQKRIEEERLTAQKEDREAVAASVAAAAAAEAAVPKRERSKSPRVKSPKADDVKVPELKLSDILGTTKEKEKSPRESLKTSKEKSPRESMKTSKDKSPRESTKTPEKNAVAPQEKVSPRAETPKKSEEKVSPRAETLKKSKELDKSPRSNDVVVAQTAPKETPKPAEPANKDEEVLPEKPKLTGKESEEDLIRIAIEQAKAEMRAERRSGRKSTRPKEKADEEPAVKDDDTTDTSALGDDASAKTTTARGVKRPSKRAATKNPIRERAKMEEDQKAESEKAALDDKNKARAGAQILGGYGLLSSVKAEEFLFAKKRLADDETRKTLSQNPLLLPKDLPRLYHIKGRRRPFAKQVERSWRSLNSGDCFILDPGKNTTVIYQWNGRDANRIEKGKAMDLAKNIKDKERFSAKVVPMEEGQEPQEFWNILGGAPTERIASKEQGGDDEEAERAYANHIVLYKLVNNEEQDKVEPQIVSEEGRPLVKSILNPACSYLLDCVSEIYVWTGLQIPSKYRQRSVRHGETAVAQREKSFWAAPLYHEWAGSEQVMFKERFADWNSVPISVAQPVTFDMNKTRSIQSNVDIAQVFTRKTQKEEIMIDDGTGKVRIWRVEEFKRVPVDESTYGEFYSGESYVILYSYIWKNKDCYLIYFWQGRTGTILGKGTSALLTIELDDRMKRNVAMSKEVRVVQGKEPRHFLTVFRGKMVTHIGKDPRSAGASPSAGSRPSTVLYDIRGTDEALTRANQTTCAAAALNSTAAFVLVSKSKCFVWKGRFSNDFETRFASDIVTKTSLKRDEVVEVAEGSETDEFWSELGGKSRYPSAEWKSRNDPRLFQCSVASGSFAIEEVLSFSQDDLIRDDVFILDAVSSVYVWMGSKSHPAEQRFAMQSATEYMTHAAAVDQRPNSTPLLRVFEKQEPFVFTTHFHGWDSGTVQQKYDEGLVDVAAVLLDYSRKYSYEDLVAKKYPKGIDETNLENYLEDSEFERVFRMKREAFSKLPLWQRQTYKRGVKLW
eukprot:m51a1_g2612 putative villin headpiece domain containing protein (1566) ;mRNA; f:504052-510269